MGYVGVVGPSVADEDDLVDAEALGRGLAERGHVVVCGGLGGVMEAVARGAARSGGVVVGLLPGTDRSAANPHVTVALPTGLGELRNALLVRSSDVVVSVGGSWGTLSEVALAMRTGVPVIALRGWQIGGTPGGAGPDDGPHRVVSVVDTLVALDALLADGHRPPAR
ncbi:TIGR00725 family protein [Cellulomonas sp. Leaf334]|uniref:TIGR00725 family protein n=1 Tax=Cellulomonas sp. Leaf334 TaxID=1736339 RepID=UPI0009E8E682|nr:TIGR00725 family protein [Cellulomonas sp. Leaf334]